MHTSHGLSSDQSHNSNTEETAVALSCCRSVDGNVPKVAEEEDIRLCDWCNQSAPPWIRLANLGADG
jgi:hypothetical protein